MFSMVVPSSFPPLGLVLSGWSMRRATADWLVARVGGRPCLPRSRRRLRALMVSLLVSPPPLALMLRLRRESRAAWLRLALMRGEARLCF